MSVSLTNPSQISQANISTSSSSESSPLSVSTSPSFERNIFNSVVRSKPFKATSVSIACWNACFRSSGVSRTRPSSTYVTLTLKRSPATFACGVSTATPLFLATRRTATSHILRSKASFGASCDACPKAPERTS